MRYLWLLLAVFLLNGPSAFAVVSPSTCVQQMGTCGYYDCLSETLHCAPDDYYVGMAKLYCEKFTSQAATLSPRGQRFVSDLRICLQEQTERTLGVLSCGNAKVHASQHHVDCYVWSGFCSLGFEDKLRIFVLASPAVVVDPLMSRTSRKINSICAAN